MACDSARSHSLPMPFSGYPGRRRVASIWPSLPITWPRCCVASTLDNYTRGCYSRGKSDEEQGSCMFFEGFLRDSLGFGRRGNQAVISGPPAPLLAGTACRGSPVVTKSVRWVWSMRPPCPPDPAPTAWCNQPLEHSCSLATRVPCGPPGPGHQGSTFLEGRRRPGRRQGRPARE